MPNLDFALDCQAFFWKEKANMLWFKDGDRNSSFSHAMVKKHVKYNGIRRLMDGDLVFDDPKHIEEHILSFYKTLYDSSDTNNVFTNFKEDMIIAYIPRVV